MLTTSRLGISYPNPDRSDAPDIPAHFLNLATVLDTAAIDGQGSLGSRPTSSPGSPGKTGRYYYATDTGRVYRDFGTGWIEVGGAPEVTSLPGSPGDGQRANLIVDAAASQGGPYVWPLIYRSTSGKWHPVGAPPLQVHPTFTSVTVGNIGFGSVAITVPVAGVYALTVSAAVSPPPTAGGAGSLYANHRVNGTDNTTFLYFTPSSPAPSTQTFTLALAAADVIAMKITNGVSGSGDATRTIFSTQLRVEPIRLG